MKNTKIIFPLIALLFVSLAGRYAYYLFLNSKDKTDRPWAYANAQGKMLTGTWIGDVKDADGELHQLEMTITNPYDDATRVDKATSKKFKRDRTKKSTFQYFATEKYKGKTITHENIGSLVDPNSNKIKWQFSPTDDQHYSGFNLNIANGTWQIDQLMVAVTFSFYTKEGYSHYVSSDPRHKYIGSMNLIKQK